MMKGIKIFVSFLLIGVIVLLLIINIRLYESPDVQVVESDTINMHLLKQLEFLEHAFDKNADAEMQSLYPEGYVFMNALYGLTWCNVISPLNTQDSLYKKGQRHIQEAFNRVNSETGRSIFNEELSLPYGSFYNGWNNYLLGKKLLTETLSDRDSTEIVQFKKQCESIASAFSKETYPPSYTEGTWPADAMVCAASLALHDRIFKPRYRETLTAWTMRVKILLDKNNLIPHSVNTSDQTISEDARGSSQSLMLIFLKEIDSSFAEEQFKIYKSKFIDQRLGLQGVREYPKGELGSGDVDSGPVILQMGGAATIVGLQTAYVFDELDLSNRINATIEALAIPYQNSTEKMYMLGKLPMVDVFVVWSKSRKKFIHEQNLFFPEFHFFSLALLLLLTGIIWLMWRRA